MVLEYANEGSLRDYLKNQFSTLNWNQKIEMALDVTRGLMCLHSENIIHRSLVSNTAINRIIAPFSTLLIMYCYFLKSTQKMY